MITFNAVKVPDDIAKLVAHSAQLDMVSVQCYCSENYAKYISCFVEAGHKTAPFLAQALGGYVLDNATLSGNSTVSFVLATPPDFSCTHRDEKQLVKKGKCLCRCGYSKPNPRFAR